MWRRRIGRQAKARFREGGWGRVKVVAIMGLRGNLEEIKRRLGLGEVREVKV